MSEERRKKKMLSTDAREVRDVPRWWFEIDIDSSFAYGLGRQGRRVRGGGARIPGMPRWCGIAAICMRRQVVACAAAVSLRAVGVMEGSLWPTFHRDVAEAAITCDRYRVSPNFTSADTGLPGCTADHQVSPGFTGFQPVSPSLTGFSLGCNKIDVA